MKICCYGDVHWSLHSSIIRSRGNKYSTRLENLITSVNWAERLAQEVGCDMVVCLGDFFDKAELNAEEITALKELVWADMPHKFLVGNHEMGKNDLSLSTAHLLSLCDNIEVIDTPTIEVNAKTRYNLVYLPYILEEDRKPISHYVRGDNNIIFSHNDLKGVQLGRFVSVDGFDIEDIQKNCNLFLNGHLHNGSKVADKIINCGNLTGQNFSEDAFTYSHSAYIIDTDDLSVAVYDNPYAFDFYKLDFLDRAFEPINVSDNAVVVVNVKAEDYEACKDWIEANGIIGRIIVNRVQSENVKEELSLSVDHIEQFKKFVLDTLGTDDIVLSELSNL